MQTMTFFHAVRVNMKTCTDVISVWAEKCSVLFSLYFIINFDADIQKKLA